MASPNISELVTTTIESRRRMLADNVTDNSALLWRLKMRGKKSPVAGGEVIYEELEYAENQTFKWFSGYETLDIRPSDVMTAAQFDFKEAAAAVTISEREQRMNSGREQMIPLLARRISNMEKTIKNNMSEGVHSDGTGHGGKQIVGLKAAIPSSPSTGTYGGIDRSAWSFWRPQRVTGVTGAGNIRAKMIELWLKTCRNKDKPDLICANNKMYNYFWQSLQENQRFHSPNVGRMGFTTIRFDTADVILDGGIGGPLADTDVVMYFINTDYIYYRPHSGSDMVLLKDRFSVNQAAMTKIMYWMGALTCSNQMLQGRLEGT